MRKHEQMAMQQRLLLPKMTHKIEDILQTSLDNIDVEAIDALCYNGLYGAAGKFDGHQYAQHTIELADGTIVVRCFLASYYRDQNPDGYKRDEEGELVFDEDGNEIDLWDDPDYDDDDLYWPETDYGEVCQFWFFRDGGMAAIAIDRNDDEWMREVNGQWQLGTDMHPVDFEMCLDALGQQPNCYDDIEHSVVDVVPTKKNLPMISFVTQFLTTYNADGSICLHNAKEGDFISGQLKQWGLNLMHEDYMLNGILSSVVKHFHTIKVAHRNGFVPESETRWKLLLDNISFCNGNIEDPRNYMPTNFNEMFDYWQQRKQSKVKRLEKERVYRIKNELADAIVKKEGSDFKYLRDKAAYLCIHFGNDKYDFEVIQNVGQFKTIGNAHGQCIYSARYFEKLNEVLLICRDASTGKYLSTVDVNLQSYSIAQNLGHGDKRHPEAAAIAQVVMENMQLFRDTTAAMQQCRDERDRLLLVQQHLDTMTDHDVANLAIQLAV